MSDADRHDPTADRPEDPAGTRPRHDPSELLPARRAAVPEEDLPDAEIVESEATDETPPETTTPSDLLPERIPDAGAPALSHAQTPHAPRFQFLTGALVAIGAGAVLIALALVIGAGSDSKDSGPKWSDWKPGTSGTAAQQIATHVGERYHLNTGRQLVLVEGGPMQVAGLPLTVALRQTAAQGGDIKLFGDKGVLFRLCGLGKDCAIADGKPSLERHLLLRREALELALYSFRYLDGVKQVTVMMPPPPGKQASQVLFFRKGELSPELHRPLDATLTTDVPSVAGVARSPDALLVDRLTLPTLFKSSLTQANQDNRAFLVLDPFTTADLSGGSSSSSGSSGSGSSGSARLRLRERQRDLLRGLGHDHLQWLSRLRHAPPWSAPARGCGRSTGTRSPSARGACGS